MKLSYRKRRRWASRIKSAKRNFRRLAITRKPMTYREKAQMMRLKMSIGKLKQELEDTQRSNLILEQSISDLAQVRERLTSLSSELQSIADSLVNNDS